MAFLPRMRLCWGAGAAQNRAASARRRSALPAGTCLFSEKALAAQNVGAAGVLIYDNNLGAYFPYSAEAAAGENSACSSGCFVCRSGAESHPGTAQRLQ